MVGGASARCGFSMRFQGSSRATVLNSYLRTSGLGPDRWPDLAEKDGDFFQGRAVIHPFDTALGQAKISEMRSRAVGPDRWQCWRTLDPTRHYKLSHQNGKPDLDLIEP